MTYILVAIAPDGTRSPLGREEFVAWNTRSRTKVERTDAHQLRPARPPDRGRALHGDAMIPLTITGASTAAAILQEPRGADLRHVLSFGDPLTGEPRGYHEHPARKLRIECDDIEREPSSPSSWYVPVSFQQVAAIVDFVRTCDGPTLIHCQAGVSRSTAAGLLLLAVHLPPDEAVAELRRIRPTAWPNRRIVGLGDELLGLDGALIAADMRWRTIRDRDGIPGYEAAP